jgi:exodeoxyribonuclease-3
MKVLSYNVNGVRSAIGKGLLNYLNIEKPDVICLQEIKATPDQLDESLFDVMDYPYRYWFPAQKKGYSGTAIISKTKPDNIQIGINNDLYDIEGRMIRADFGNVSIASLYMPSGSSGDERQDFKMKFLDYFGAYIESLLKENPRLVLSGDFNICHQAIDIHDPKGNAKSSGFLPEERAWFGEFLKLGFVDSFREINPSTQKYSWWSFRFNARKNNKGWRIDYNLLSNALIDNLVDASIDNNAIHSDHCPVIVEF